MYIKIINYLKNLSFRQRNILDNQEKQLAFTNEVIWANVYHDSIKGNKALENLSLNIGRWAGNYSFFYILHRILKEFKPKNIMDLGLGESSKFVSTYISNFLPETTHTIGEHDEEWINFFSANFTFTSQSKIQKLELIQKKIFDFEVNAYHKFDEIFTDFFDFIIIDAPFGSPHYSRFDIVKYIENQKFDEDFVIILDDTNRTGEQETLKIIIEKLKEKRSDVFYADYSGAKTSTIITNKKFLTSL